MSSSSTTSRATLLVYRSPFRVVRSADVNLSRSDDVEGLTTDADLSFTVLMRAWRHLLLLIALAVGAAFLTDLLSGAPIRAGGWAGAPRAALGALPDILVPALAVALAIAVGTLPPNERSTRQAARMTIVISLVMIVIDLLLPDTGSLRTMTASIRGLLGDTGEVIAQYPLSHPRLRAVHALQQGALLLAPTVLVGILLGVSAWIHSRVVFRTERDGTMARWIVSWILAPGVLAFVINWSQGLGADVLFRGEPLWIVVTPWLPALVVSLLGWRAAARTSNDVDTAIPA